MALIGKQRRDAHAWPLVTRGLPIAHETAGGAIPDRRRTAQRQQQRRPRQHFVHHGDAIQRLCHLDVHMQARQHAAAGDMAVALEQIPEVFLVGRNLLAPVGQRMTAGAEHAQSKWLQGRAQGLTAATQKITGVFEIAEYRRSHFDLALEHLCGKPHTQRCPASLDGLWRRTADHAQALQVSEKVLFLNAESRVAHDSARASVSLENRPPLRWFTPGDQCPANAPLVLSIALERSRRCQTSPINVFWRQT